MDCVIHRPEVSEPIQGLEAFRKALERILQVYSEFKTTIHDVIAEEDRRVACRLSYQVCEVVANAQKSEVEISAKWWERRSLGRQSQFFDFTIVRSPKNGLVGTSWAC